MALLIGCTGLPPAALPSPSVTKPVTDPVTPVSSTSSAQATSAAATSAQADGRPTLLSTPAAATSTPVSTATPVPAAATTYRVAYVTADDVLNVRPGPGIEFDVIGTLAPQATGVQAASSRADEEWVEIEAGAQIGWVNRYFLTEQVLPETFCNDPAVQEVVEAFLVSLEASAGEELEQLIHPQRGLLVRVNWWNNELRYSQTEAQGLFSGDDQRDWGYQDGSGEPIEGSFGEVVLPLLAQDVAGDPQFYCNELVTGASAGLIQLPFEYEAVNYIAVHRPATENELDWGTWVLGIEYWQGQPFLSFLVHYQWEI
jgi:hypothetical protein